MMENEPKLAQVFHFDLYGKREAKYDFLNQNSLKSIEWNNLTPEAPNFFLVKKDFDQSGMYELGFKIDEMFQVNGVGVVTSKDNILISESKKELTQNVENYYKIKFDNSIIQKIDYRTFDQQFIYYDVKIVDRAREKIMKHLLQPNIAIVTPKQAIKGFKHVFISKNICDKNLIDSAGQFGAGNIFPLYLYPEGNSQDLFAKTERTPNLNAEIVNKMAESLGLKFVNEPVETLHRNVSTFAPIDVLDYIYAVLHSPAYREKYKEFLKIDFPRVPFPSPRGGLTKAQERFWALVALGAELRQLHLLESPVVEEYITQYPEDGDNVVRKPSFAPSQLGRVGATDASVGPGRVYINASQYFDNVPEIAWNFYIGGYQPAQKWLKDRKERELSFEDILHYQKIIVALTQTHHIMTKINNIDIEAN